jgi:hypothetical protein
MHICLLLAALAAMPGGDSTAVEDIGRLAAALDSDDFAVREQAEERLVAEGLKTVERLIESSPLPEGATDPDADRHFENLANQVETELAKSLYRHLDALAGLEPRYRAQRIRRTLASKTQSRLRLDQAGFNRRLPAAVAEQVHGYTGGFREGTTWFDAEYTNNSRATVTSIRILVRLTHKKTGEKTEREGVLGVGQPPLAPGQTVSWSADVGMAQTRDHDFFWDTVAIYGTSPPPEIVPISDEPSALPDLPVIEALPRLKK